MMNKLYSCSLIALTALAVGGCGSSTQVIDTADTSSSRVRSMNKTSSVDYLEAAVAGGNAVLSSDVFNRFLSDYHAANGSGSQPLMMVSKIVNKTTAHIDTALLTERMSETLLNSGLVQVTSAAGEDRDNANAQVRDLEYDENFNQSSVVKRGTLDSPDLSLSGQIITMENRDGRTTELTVFFSMTLTNLKNGRVVWKYNKELGRVETKNIFGY